GKDTEDWMCIDFGMSTFQDSSVSSSMTLTGNSNTGQISAECSSEEIVPIKVILPV
uniref:Uncharacterized protein n=1 Tax=Tetraodon nigroviridis TaxID=99883 RepID=H3C374_TETNG